MTDHTVRRRLGERGPLWRYVLAAFVAAIFAIAVAWVVGWTMRSVDVLVGWWIALLAVGQIAAGFVATPPALRHRRMSIFLWGASAAAAQPSGEWLGLETYLVLGKFGFRLVRDDPQHFTLQAVDAAIRMVWLAVWWGFFAFVVWIAWLAFAPRLPRLAATRSMA